MALRAVGTGLALGRVRAELPLTPTDENSAIAHNNLATFKYRTGDVKGALESVELALLIDPDWHKALTNRAVLRDLERNAPVVLAELPGTVPDGIAFATDGSVVIACYRPDVVYRWRADLGLEVLAEDPEGTVIAAPTNCAFTGPALATIVVPNIGRWHATRFRVPGLVGVPLFYPTAEQLGETPAVEATR